jgi:hypothetical protein
MAKEKEESESSKTREREGGEKSGKGEREEHGGKKSEGGKKRPHLHEIRSVQAEDGSIVHHHTYKKSKDDHFTMPERGPMATSSTPEEAGQHVSEQFAQNQQGGEEPEEAQGEESQGAEPQAGAAQAQPGM